MTNWSGVYGRKLLEEKITKKFIEVLAKKDASLEEKKAQALLKSVLLSENLFTFIKEFNLASNGQGRIRVETVKGVVEYARAYNEARIREIIGPDDKVEAIVDRENNRLTQAETWALWALSCLGLL